MDDRSPRQREFIERLNALLVEFTESVGPGFDGDEDEGIEMEMPVALGWILITQWTDVGGDGIGSTVQINSETLAYPTRVGLLAIASRMADEES